MLKHLQRHLAVAALSLGAVAITSAAAAEGHDGAPYWSGDGWTVNQLYSETAGWCAAYADYRGGQRIVLVGRRDAWTLRVSATEWSQLEQGRRYTLFLNTDRRWTSRYEAEGYHTASAERSGYTAPISARALDALARGRVVYLVDDAGVQIAALDLTGSARAIGALRDCRSDLQRTGGFSGRPETAPIAEVEAQAPAISASAEQDGSEVATIIAPSEGAEDGLSAGAPRESAAQPNAEVGQLARALEVDAARELETVAVATPPSAKGDPGSPSDLAASDLRSELGADAPSASDP